jgi:hypothetical protein
LTYGAVRFIINIVNRIEKTVILLNKKESKVKVNKFSIDVWLRNSSLILLNM